MNSSTKPEIDPDILLARQPIFDRNMGLYGYELLYRQNDSTEFADFLCGDTATSLLLLNNYASLSQATEHHRVPAFINITENLIKSEVMLPVAPELVVLEILEDVTPDQALIDAILRYKNAGFKIALDDYPFTPEFEKLLEHADFIKVDVLNFDLKAIKGTLNYMKNFNAQLLAEKVEDNDCYVRCLELGFHLFQGYFFERPQIVRGKQLSSNKQLVLKLLSDLFDPQIKPEAIARTLSQDAELSYRLLRIINSAAYGLNRKIHSIKEAIVYMGLSQLKRWITLLAFSTNDDTPPELLRTLLVRGRVCELISEKMRFKETEDFFTSGLFSGIDSLLGVDLNFLINELPLTSEIKQAILQYKGTMGDVLKSVVHFERAQWDSMPQNVDLGVINKSYFEAIQWCDEMTSMLKT